MPEQKSTPRSPAERVNHFLNGERKVTETDAALAIAYYPLLVDLAGRRRTITFKDFVDLAKTTYPDNPAVQNAIPVSTGRRLEFVRVFTAVNGLPDLSAWVTGQSGKNSAVFQRDFDPVEERRRSAEEDWSRHEAAWEAHAADLRKRAQKITPRNELEARSLMAEFAQVMRPRIEAAIPNPKKLPYVKLVMPFRETILEDLKSGLDPQDVFENVLIDMRNDQLDQSDPER
jgi:hypothetical protein